MPPPPFRPTFEARLAAALPRLEVFIRARLGAALAREHDPLDIAQDVLAAAWAARSRFDVASDVPDTDLPPLATPAAACPLSGWLCRLAERRIVDLARRASRLKRPPAEARVTLTALVDAYRASRSGPVSAAARAEAHERLSAALQQLDDDARVAILARHFEGLTLEEVAARLGRSEPGVRRLLGRAHVALGAALRGFCEGSGA
jgi:RNA polymerase sigma factor (sigma-70 family)